MFPVTFTTPVDIAVVASNCDDPFVVLEFDRMLFAVILPTRILLAHCLSNTIAFVIVQPELSENIVVQVDNLGNVALDLEF